MVILCKDKTIIGFIVERKRFPRKRKKMANKKNQTAVGQMIQRCHKWRQKRKQFIDQARQISDEVERERLLQAAEHYCRIANEEQSKIDSQRDPKDKNPIPEEVTESTESTESTEQNDSGDEEEISFPDFITNLQ